MVLRNMPSAMKEALERRVSFYGISGALKCDFKDQPRIIAENWLCLYGMCLQIKYITSGLRRI